MTKTTQEAFLEMKQEGAFEFAHFMTEFHSKYGAFATLKNCIISIKFLISVLPEDKQIAMMKEMNNIILHKSPKLIKVNCNTCGAEIMAVSGAENMVNLCAMCAVGEKVEVSKWAK